MKFPNAILIASLLATSVARAAAPAQDAAGYWHSVAAGGFTNVLATFEREPIQPWPPVVSVAAAQSSAGPQATFRDISEQLAQQMEAYERDLRNLSSADFAKNARRLLAMRDHLCREPSYVNLVLLDAINRVLYVNLVTRLAASDPVTPAIAKIVDDLALCRLDLQAFRVLVETELGRSVVDGAAFATASDMERLKLLWSALEPDTQPMFPKDVQHIGTHELLKRQSLTLLLNRSIMSDFFIRSSLPAFSAYRQKAESYSSQDSYQQIKAVLGQDERVNQSVGSDLLGIRRAASVVSDVLQSLHSGRLQQQLLFTTSSPAE